MKVFSMDYTVQVIHVPTWDYIWTWYFLIAHFAWLSSFFFHVNYWVEFFFWNNFYWVVCTKRLSVAVIRVHGVFVFQMPM